MTKQIGSRTLLAITVLLGTVSLSLAAEGRIPIRESTTITASGNYFLTRDITATLTAGLTLAAGDIDLDLNGMTVWNPLGGAGIVATSGVGSLIIRNGTIRVLGNSAIYAFAVGSLVVEDVKIPHYAPGAPSADNGIFVIDVEEWSIRRNIIETGLSCGIIVTAGAGTIENNVVHTTGTGIAIGDSTTGIGVLNNRLSHNDYGITLSVCAGVLVAGNTVHRSNLEGIGLFEASGCTVRQNVVTYSGSDGIFLDSYSHDNLLLSNNSSWNDPGSGLRIEGKRNVIRDNLLNRNASGFGLHFVVGASENVWGDNTARGNTGAPTTCISTPPCGLPPDLCEENATPNDSAGGNMASGPPDC